MQCIPYVYTVALVLLYILWCYRSTIMYVQYTLPVYE